MQPNSVISPYFITVIFLQVFVLYLCKTDSKQEIASIESTHPIPFENKIFTYSLQMNHTFRLGNKWTASLDGRYQSCYLIGDQEQNNPPYLNMGIKKEFVQGNSLGIVFQDLTNSSYKHVWEYSQPALDVRTFGLTNLSERQLRVTYTHLFGNKKLTVKRQRKTGTEEIKDRM